MQFTAHELSLLLNGKVEGDPLVSVSKLAKIEEAGSGSLSFLANPKYEHFLYTTNASVVIVNADFGCGLADQVIPTRLFLARSAVPYQDKTFVAFLGRFPKWLLVRAARVFIWYSDICCGFGGCCHELPIAIFIASATIDRIGHLGLDVFIYSEHDPVNAELTDFIGVN